MNNFSSCQIYFYFNPIQEEIFLDNFLTSAISVFGNMKKEIAKELTKHNMVFCDFIGVFFFQLKKKIFSILVI